MDRIIDIINVLSIIYVGLPLLFILAVAIYYLRGKRIQKETWEKILDFGKWYLVSISIVIAAKVVENGFKERETGLKEMDGFEKYVSIITDSKSIDKRWELCTYFSTVTPTKRLRDGWKMYKDSIRKDYEKFMVLANKENAILKKDSLTKQDEKALKIINIDKAKFETSLSGDADGDHVIIFTSDKDTVQAKYELAKIAKIVESPRMVLRDGFYLVISKYYHSRNEAQSFLNTIKNKFTSSPYVSNMSRWCSDPVFNGTFYQCR